MSKPRSKLLQTIYTQMDESVKANHRWASGPNQEGAQNYFIRYTSGNDNNTRQVDTVQSRSDVQRQFISEVSQTSYADNFKKIKYNQMQALKELRQEYQILRDLPLQDDFLGRSHMKKQQTSDFESSHQEQESLSSSSSKQTDKRKSKKNHNHSQSQSQAKDTQILTLEKRQLELVIGNSMRKIQELLNNEIQYKKVIHELQIQLDSKSTDDKYDNMSKTMKRNEIEFNDRIESLKRDIERLKQINLQLQNKNDTLESQLENRNQQLRKCREEKRVLEDSLRLQKDRYLNLQIDIKRVRMESQILEKDKNNEIKQLKLLLQTSSNKIIEPDTTEIRRLQDQLKSAKHQYDMLLNEFDRYKRQAIQKPVQVKDNKQNEDMLKVFDTLISHLKDESVNQNKASMELIASMVSKYDEKTTREKERQRQRKQRERQLQLQELERERQREIQRQRERQRQLERQKQKKEKEKERKKIEKSTVKVIQDPNANRLLQQLFHLRNEVSTLKRDKDDLNKSSPMINLAESMADYQSKIRKLEQEIADGSITKEKLLKEYEVVKSSYDYATKENQRLTQEVLKLRERINQAEHHGQLSTQQIRISFRQKEQDYQQTVRQLRRQVDQALFAVDKASKEGQLNLGLLRSQNETNLKLLREQVSRVESERQLLKAQLNKMKVFYESKVHEKNALLERTSQQFAAQFETKEKTLVAYKANSQRQMNEMIRKIDGVAQLNERYLKQSTLLSTYERQLSQLRYAVKRMKGMNEGVDHLWQVKETEYYNLNDVLRQLKGQ